MAQEYISMKQDANGIIALSTNVFTSVVKICIEEDPNVKLIDQGPFKSTINTHIEDDKLFISFNVNVKYNVNVQDTCQELQHKIFDNIKHMCGIEPAEIDIKVSGFEF